MIMPVSALSLLTQVLGTYLGQPLRPSRWPYNLKADLAARPTATIPMSGSSNNNQSIYSIQAISESCHWQEHPLSSVLSCSYLSFTQDPTKSNIHHLCPHPVYLLRPQTHAHTCVPACLVSSIQGNGHSTSHKSPNWIRQLLCGQVTQRMVCFHVKMSHPLPDIS